MHAKRLVTVRVDDTRLPTQEFSKFSGTAQRSIGVGFALAWVMQMGAPSALKYTPTVQDGNPLSAIGTEPPGARAPQLAGRLRDRDGHRPANLPTIYFGLIPNDGPTRLCADAGNMAAGGSVPGELVAGLE
jgi:hypothetical protein